MSALIHKVNVSLPMAVMVRKHMERFPVKFTATADVIEKASVIDNVINTFDWYAQISNETKPIKDVDFDSVPFLAFPSEFLIMNRKHRFGLAIFYSMRSDLWKFFSQNIPYVTPARCIWGSSMEVTYFGRDNMFNRINTSAFMELAAKHQRLCMKYENMDAIKRISANISASGGFLPY